MTMVEINKTAKNVPKNNELRMSPISFHSSWASSIEAFVTTRLESLRNISMIFVMMALLSFDTAAVSPEPLSMFFQEDWGERFRQVFCGLSSCVTSSFPDKSF